MMHSFFGDTAAVKRLLQAGANVNIAAEDTKDAGVTALIYAAKEGHADVMKLLVDFKANLQPCDKNGDTALDKAVKAKHEQCAAVLREHGGRHSLLYAAAEGMLEAVAAGIAAGDDVNVRDRVGCP